MTTREIIELLAVIIMIISLLGILVERIMTKRGIGLRVIQLCAVVFVIPTILILALEELLNPETIAAILGAMIGYVLSGLVKDETSIRN